MKAAQPHQLFVEGCGYMAYLWFCLWGCVPQPCLTQFLLLRAVFGDGNLIWFWWYLPAQKSRLFDVNISKNGNTRFLLCLSQDSEFLLYIQ